ncbi:hypothetical protein RSAG8_13623, partial [Rhizoctonia solani AG-8 WAC10335]
MQTRCHLAVKEKDRQRVTNWAWLKRVTGNELANLQKANHALFIF